MRARGHDSFRIVYIWTDFCPPHLPAERGLYRCQAYCELIPRASEIPVGAESEPRNARLLQMLVDEIAERALHLPTGKDPRRVDIADGGGTHPLVIEG